MFIIFLEPESPQDKSPAGDQLWNSGREYWIFSHFRNREGVISDPGYCYKIMLAWKQICFWCLDTNQNASGLKITAGQRTMSGLIVSLTGQTLVWPVILTGHFWMVVAYLCVLLYNAVIRCFLWLFCCFALNPLKKNFLLCCDQSCDLLWENIR